MAILNTDALLVERGGVHYQSPASEMVALIKGQIGDIYPTPVADATARDALTGLSVGDTVHITDDGDGNWARYMALTVDAGGSGLTWEKIADQDQLAAVGTNLGYTAAPASGTVTSDSGTDATIPVVDATNAGLQVPADKAKVDFISVTQAVDLDQMETDSHVPAVTAGTAATNPVSIVAATQTIGFDITTLAVAP